MLNKNNLCKPAAKKDTIHNAVIKELYIGSRREVMGSYASFDAAYYSASTKIFRPWRSATKVCQDLVQGLL